MAVNVCLFQIVAEYEVRPQNDVDVAVISPQSVIKIFSFVLECVQ